MATEKSEVDLLAEIATLIPNNSSRQVSPLDMRTVLENQVVQGAMGAIYFSDPGNPISKDLVSTPGIITGFTNSTPYGHDAIVPDHTTDQIQVNVDGSYLVGLNITFTGPQNTQFTFFATLDGVVIPVASGSATPASTNDAVSATMTVPAGIPAGGRIELWGATANSDEILIQAMSLWAYRGR